MALTLAEVLQQLEAYRYELRVWTLIENSLCPYLDQDMHRQAEAGLKVKGCSEAFVPPEVFEQIIETIRAEKIEPITQKIDAIEGLSVEDRDDDEEDKKHSKKAGKKVSKKVGKKVRKKGSIKGAKGLLSVSGRTRQKGTGSG